MKDCTGLEVVHHFVQIAYLQAKRATLLAAACANEAQQVEAEASLLELIKSKLDLSSRERESQSLPDATDKPEKDWLGRPLHTGCGASTRSAVVPKLDAPPAASPARAPAAGLQFAAHSALPTPSSQPAHGQTVVGLSNTSKMPTVGNTEMKAVTTANTFSAPCDVIDESFFATDEVSPSHLTPRAACAPASLSSQDASNEVEDLLPLLDDPNEV